MRIGVIGTGYVGLVIGAGLAELGHVVTCTDKDVCKIRMLQQGGLPLYEPGLKELTEKHASLGRLLFEEDTREAIKGAGVVFVAVGTEGLPDGRVDLNAVHEVGETVAKTMDSYVVIAIKSTVPVGTALSLFTLIREKQQRPTAFEVVSNPEFQREGSAVEDFFRPSRIIIGTSDERARKIMREVYRPLLAAGIPLVQTTNEAAELAKYVSNAFLAVRISFINEVANLCDQLSCDVQEVVRCVTLDPRIGGNFFQPGPGFGGSCFPKDTRALVWQGQEKGALLRILEAAVRVNEAQPGQVLKKVKFQLEPLSKRTVAILGLSYKANTDDVRESPAIRVCELLVREGAFLRAYDPMANENARKVIPGEAIKFYENPYDACSGADCLVVLTEWEEFKNLDLPRIKSLLRGNLIVDTRNVFRPDSVVQCGLVYEGIGRRADRSLHGMEVAGAGPFAPTL